jgi:excisionase family DNA binding protein
MTSPRMALLIDAGTDCWMNPAEAASYTGAGRHAVTHALFVGELPGVRIPAGSLTDCLIAKSDLDEWVARRQSAHAA